MDKPSNASAENDLKVVRRPIPRWVVDRVENGWAVLDNTDTLENINLPLSNLPKNTKPGDTLVRQGGKWYKDDIETAARQTRISERLAKIKAKNG